VFRIGGNTFYDRKDKIPMKILEFKRSRNKIIAESRRIPNGFPNQDARDFMEAVIKEVNGHINNNHLPGFQSFILVPSTSTYVTFTITFVNTLEMGLSRSSQ
jgi:hypothetical protein